MSSPQMTRMFGFFAPEDFAVAAAARPETFAARRATGPSLRFVTTQLDDDSSTRPFGAARRRDANERRDARDHSEADQCLRVILRGGGAPTDPGIRSEHG